MAKLCREGDVTYPALYAAFSELCDSIQEPIDLCGLSLGGVLALHYAIEHPNNVHSLVLIAAQYKMPKQLLRLQNLLFHFMPSSMFRQTGFQKKDFLQLCKSMMDLDFSSSISEINCPTLVICGAKDSANNQASKGLATAISGAQLQVIPNCGHEVNLEAPEQLAEILRNFYTRIQ